ncbi:uncharacterized protein LOC132729409 [Ruditapes philippinarum]|uniref:uncharacterized protein LOC132729409 n=1 Tax=Ruditapes philippinarum TaxID=129788 RepID=UPI00295C2CC5|nr:uncharacterized protein LOC132729409 [Ruditapes philippinarum]
MKGFWIYLVLCSHRFLVDCELLGNNTFTIISKSPLNDGIWKSIAICNIDNSGHTYSAHETYIVSRFGVPILTYKDYLSGGYEEIAQSGKWVISRVGYGSSGQLSFNPEFSYDIWLGKGIPSGDCYQFRGQQAAENFAYNAEELTDTPADNPD